MKREVIADALIDRNLFFVWNAKAILYVHMYLTKRALGIKKIF